MTIDVPETKCLACGDLLHFVTSVTGENTPSPGDPIVCSNCGAIATIDETGNLCPFTEAQANVFLNDPEWMRMMKRVIKTLHFVRHAKN